MKKTIDTAAIILLIRHDFFAAMRAFVVCHTNYTNMVHEI